MEGLGIDRDLFYLYFILTILNTPTGVDSVYMFLLSRKTMVRSCGILSSG